MFSTSEMRMIAKAKTKASHAKTVRILILFAMVLAIGLMTMGRADIDQVAYGLVAAVLVAIAYPQFGNGPKYEDLVRLLDQKSRDIAE